MDTDTEFESQSQQCDDFEAFQNGTQKLSQGSMAENSKVIPLLYGVYLLNSLSKKSCYYVGSTPDPKRRLRQHNGELTCGGAYRTKKQGYRPWRMAIYVYGFPSKINALQFEHAWQHSYQTRHIKFENRISPGQKHTGSGTSLHSKLANCRLLLASDSFKRLGLKVAIFNNATYDLWLKNRYGIKIPDDILLDIRTGSEVLDDSTFNTGNYNQLVKFMEDATTLQTEYFEKCIQLYQNGVPKTCSICNEEAKITDDFNSLCICVHADCESCYHMKCLAEEFLKNEKEKVQILPKKGKCVSCKKMNFWNLIIRGSKHLVHNYS